MRRLGEEYEPYDRNKQFEVRFTDGEWYLIPSPGTINKTFVNGAHVPDSVATILHNGDEISVGNPTTNKTVLPIKVVIVTP